VIRELSRFQLIIIDEMGYLPFDDFGAHCFFQLVSRRYERSSIIFTSNKSYGEWGDIFKDHVIAAAILDRILHHCTTVNIKGDSYRLKDRKRQGIIPQSFSGEGTLRYGWAEALSRTGQFYSGVDKLLSRGKIIH